MTPVTTPLSSFCTKTSSRTDEDHVRRAGHTFSVLDTPTCSPTTFLSAVLAGHDSWPATGKFEILKLTICSSREGEWTLRTREVVRVNGFGVGGPHGGVRGFRSFSNPGCYVTRLSPNKAIKSIARGKLTFDERVVLHRVDVPHGGRTAQSSPLGRSVIDRGGPINPPPGGIGPSRDWGQCPHMCLSFLESASLRGMNSPPSDFYWKVVAQCCNQVARL